MSYQLGFKGYKNDQVTLSFRHTQISQGPVSMFAKVIALLSLVCLVEVSSMSMMIDRCSVIEYILNMDVKCSGLVTIFDEEYSEENEEDIAKLILKKNRPLILFQNHNGRVNVSEQQISTIKETVCSDAILFVQNLDDFPPIYEQVNDYFHAKKVILVTSNSSTEADKLLGDIRSDNFFLLIERSQRLLEMGHQRSYSKEFRV